MLSRVSSFDDSAQPLLSPSHIRHGTPLCHRNTFRRGDEGGSGRGGIRRRIRRRGIKKCSNAQRGRRKIPKNLGRCATAERRNDGPDVRAVISFQPQDILASPAPSFPRNRHTRAVRIDAPVAAPAINNPIEFRSTATPRYQFFPRFLFSFFIFFFVFFFRSSSIITSFVECSRRFCRVR